jgi:hypothetical protein
MMKSLAKGILVFGVAAVYVGWLLAMADTIRKAAKAGKMRLTFGWGLYIVVGLLWGGGFALWLVSLILSY